MSASAYVKQLQHLQINESSALGTLKGHVAGMLIIQESGMEPTLKQWGRLRLAYDATEAAASDILRHIMLPVGED